MISVCSHAKMVKVLTRKKGRESKLVNVYMACAALPTFILCNAQRTSHFVDLLPALRRPQHQLAQLACYMIVSRDVQFLQLYAGAAVISSAAQCIYDPTFSFSGASGGVSAMLAMSMWINPFADHFIFRTRYFSLATWMLASFYIAYELVYVLPVCTTPSQRVTSTS